MKLGRKADILSPILEVLLKEQLLLMRMSGMRYFYELNRDMHDEKREGARTRAVEVSRIFSFHLSQDRPIVKFPPATCFAILVIARIGLEMIRDIYNPKAIANSGVIKTINVSV